jgi:hypothetical protein
LELKELQTLDPLLHANNPYKPLISQLLKDPLYKKVYLSHIRQIVEENFLNGSYEKRAQELQGLIVVPYSDYQEKSYNLNDFQGNLKTTVGKKSKIPGLTELMSKRAQFLKKHAELTALPSVVSDVSVQGRAKFENLKLNNFRVSAKADKYPKRMWLYYRFSDKEAYSVISMSEESAADLPAGTKAFMGVVEAKGSDAVLDYYIMVENAGTVSFQPAAYTRQPIKVKLSDLNK